MSEQPRIVHNLGNSQLIESHDGTMRDVVMITNESCGSQQFSTGLFWVRPGTRGHEDHHPGQEEVYYIFQGKGEVVIEGKPHVIQAGDMVFIPDGLNHYLTNEGPETLGLCWVIAKKWTDMPGIGKELAKWNKIQPGSEWGPLPAKS